eukprot:1810478-Pyramimonas_sp.AAC.1
MASEPAADRPCRAKDLRTPNSELGSDLRALGGSSGEASRLLACPPEDVLTIFCGVHDMF